MTEIMAGVFLVLVAFVVAVSLDSASCHSRWESSGMSIQYGPIKGCLIQTKDGKWIPTDNYREQP